MSAICLEHPINKNRVSAIATNNSAQRPIIRAVYSGMNSNSAITGSYGQNSRAQTAAFPTRTKGVRSTRRFSVASRFGDKIRDIGVLIAGIVALEAVLTLTFRPFEGLFLIIPTLAVGTTLYVSDGTRR